MILTPYLKHLSRLGLGVAITIPTACNTLNTETEKPNIILIMADDLGYGDLGCYGNDDIKTPNIDFLAENGIRFTDFHSNAPVCTPTRAALLTGKYQQRTGLEGVIFVGGHTRETGLDSSLMTIADVLKSNGYVTGIMGKWHLGYHDRYNPVINGFDEFYGYRSGNIDYHSHYDNAGIYDWYHNLDSIYEEGYVTNLLTEHSINFITKNTGNPFFLYVSHESPHVPFQGPNDPAYRFPDTEFTQNGPVEDRNRAYREMIEIMDEGIGEIMKTLEKNNLLENTLVFFLSDNGAITEYGNNGGLNGAKTTLYEGGHRVPAIAFWKGKIGKGRSDATLMSFDLFPTFTEICGAKIPAESKIDGVDFSPVLFGKQIVNRDLFWRYGNEKAVRSGNWKLLIRDKDTLVYNLKEDLPEKNNVIENETELKNTLLEKLNSWEEEMDVYELKTL